MFNFLLDIKFLYLHKNFQFLFIELFDCSFIIGKLNLFRNPKLLFFVKAICFSYKKLSEWQILPVRWKFIKAKLYLDILIGNFILKIILKKKNIINC